MQLNRILFDTNTHSGQAGVGFPWNKGGDLVPSPPSAAAPGSHEVRKPQASFQEGAPGATLGTPVNDLFSQLPGSVLLSWQTSFRHREDVEVV